MVKTVKYKTEELAINPNKFRNPLVQKQMDEILNQKSKEAANLIKGITEKQSDVLSNKIREAYLKGKYSRLIMLSSIVCICMCIIIISLEYLRLRNAKRSR